MCFLVFIHAATQAVVYFKLRTFSFSSSLLGSAAASEAFWGRPEKRLFKLNLLEMKGWIVVLNLAWT